MRLTLQSLSAITVTDEEGLQHVNQEIETKITAPFGSDRFGFLFSVFLSVLIYFFYWCIVFSGHQGLLYDEL